MPMKKQLSFILFILCVNNMFSQESTNLILQYYGLKENPYKEAFISSNLSSNSTQEEIQFLNDYYIKNEKEILTKYDNERFVYYVEILKDANKKSMEAAISGLNFFANSATQVIAAYNQGKAMDKQRQAAEEAKRHEEMQALIAQGAQKRAAEDAAAEKRRMAYSSNNQSSSNGYTTQGSYNDLLTSDPNWNTQVQMWVQQYGVEKTREMVKQQRASNYQQSAQSSRSNSYNQSMSGKIISAVTSSRQQLKIKVNGNSVVAYSNGLDQVGRQNWISVVPGAGISKTGAGSLYSTGNLSKEFSCTANVNGMQIYFDM